MKLSRYFSNHARAYDAEMDDLVSDSEGKNVLEKRLKEKRSQLDFLVVMMDDSPEMLAAAFHQGFRFPSAKAMDLLVALEPEEFPDWDKLARTITLTPWAQAMADRVLREPTGEQFMVVAACLEYLYTRADDRGAAVEDESDDEEDHDLDPEEQEARDREDAGAAWMEEQGFDPKPPKA
nr:hypothetical protein [uncultured Albidiferax sp.]